MRKTSVYVDMCATVIRVNSPVFTYRATGAVLSPETVRALWLSNYSWLCTFRSERKLSDREFDLLNRYNDILYHNRWDF